MNFGSDVYLGNILYFEGIEEMKLALCSCGLCNLFTIYFIYSGDLSIFFVWILG